jgi:hypothetical protein
MATLNIDGRKATVDDGFSKLSMADPTDPAPVPAFTWGANGARMTPEQIAAQRKVADALALQAGDGSPFPVGTRGAGLVTQGLARVAKGISAGVDYREADAADKANASDNATMIASLLGAQGGRAAAPVASAPVAAVSAPVASPTPDSSPKIYTNDEPSPLDPPSGADRVKMIATILGEENTPAGQAGVANVIRNRAVDGGYGGDTPSAVVTAPNQFEPWNTPEGRQRMAAAASDPKQVAAANAAIDGAYGTNGRAPEDPTEGKTMFYAPAAQAALGRPAPSWAQGPGQTLGHTAFYDEPEDGAVAPGVAAVAKAAAGAPASNDPAALPVNSMPTQGGPLPAVAPVAAPSPAVAKVAGAMNPGVLQALTSPYASPATKQIASLVMAQQMKPKAAAAYKDADGNLMQVGPDGTLHAVIQADKDPAAVKEFQYGQTHPDFAAQKASEKDPTSIKEYEYYKKNLPDGQAAIPYDVWSTAKARASATNVSTNVDMGTSQTYDKQLAEGLGKSHAALANGVEDAQSRARDIAAMQGAVDAIQKNGGTTGGMLPAQRLELQKSINAGASALGIEKPFDENDISDKEFLTKFNRTMAGAQAKNAVGSRVTNFEMSNFLKANPGLDMSITGNQRLLGIQGQIEQRNIAVGNAIRDATAQAISAGKKIDPVTVQGIITNYDAEHHITEPVTGQDLTQSYALPEFQTQGNNPALAAQHETNVGKIRTWHPDTGVAP